MNVSVAPAVDRTAAVQAAAQPVLAVKNIEVIYNHVILVLRGVSLEVPQGKIVALLGASGCGKTTTLRMIAGLVTPDQGRISIAGRIIVLSAAPGRILADRTIETPRGALTQAHVAKMKDDILSLITNAAS